MLTQKQIDEMRDTFEEHLLNISQSEPDDDRIWLTKRRDPVGWEEEAVTQAWANTCDDATDWAGFEIEASDYEVPNRIGD